MPTKTAHTLYEALKWIETTPHHFASVEDPRYLVLRGRGETLRVPKRLQDSFWCHTMVGDQFDTRMFRANPGGLSVIRERERGT